MNEGFVDILAQAERLGQVIRRHPRYAALRAADERVRADKGAADALDAYNKAAAHLQQKGRAGLAIEVEEKRNLERLRQVVAANEAVKVFMKTQADYAELMHRMNEAIYRAIAEGEAAPGSQG